MKNSDTLTFGELREALKDSFPEQSDQDREVLMVVVWSHVFHKRMAKSGLFLS